MAESGFPESAQALRTAWFQGDQVGSERAVSDAMVVAVVVAGAPAECHDRIEAYRRFGFALPIILPILQNGGSHGKQWAMDAIYACMS